MRSAVFLLLLLSLGSCESSAKQRNFAREPEIEEPVTVLDSETVRDVSDGASFRPPRVTNGAHFCQAVQPRSTTKPETAARVAFVFDAVPVQKRDWKSLATSRWLLNSSEGQWVSNHAMACYSIQYLGGSPREPDWQQVASCKNKKGKHLTQGPDTPAAQALRRLCSYVERDDSEFQVAVLAFDHIVDGPSGDREGVLPHEDFAKAVRGCLDAGLAMAVVAQPQALRYAYVLSKPSHEDALASLSSALHRMFSSARMHGNAEDAVFSKQEGVCPDDKCPPAFVLRLDAHGIKRPRRRLELTAEHPTFESNERPALPLIDFAAWIDSSNAPDQHLLVLNPPVGSPLASKQGYGTIGIRWQEQSQDSPEGYPYLSFELGTRSLQRVLTGCTPQHELDVRVNTEENPGYVEVAVMRANIHDQLIQRTIDNETSLVMDKGPEASSSTNRKRFDTLLTERVPRATNVSKELYVSGIIASCAVDEIAASLGHFKDFRDADLRAIVCEAKSKCRELEDACRSREGAFFQALLDTPSIVFRPKNEQSPANARVAIVGMALVLAQAVEHIRAWDGGELTRECVTARFELGCTPVGAN